MSESDNDSLDDLFSFSTSTNDENRAASSSPINFDVDTDVFDADKNPTSSTSSGIDKSSIEEDFLQDKDSNSDEMGSGHSGVKMERISSVGEDSFLEVFEDGGIANENSKTLKTETTDEVEDFLKEETDDTGMTNEDDFHQHDAGTRDFLEWLDTDGTAAKTEQPEQPLDVDIDMDIDVDVDMDLHADDIDKKADAPSSSPLPSNESSNSFDFEKEILDDAEDATVLVDPVSSESKPPILDVQSDAKNDADKKTDDNSNKSSSNRPDDSLTKQLLPSTEIEAPDKALLKDQKSSTPTPPSPQLEPNIASIAHEESLEELPPSPDPPELPELTRNFATLSEAVSSLDSTYEQIKMLFKQEQQTIDSSDRPNLWLKNVCAKPTDYVTSSSIADSFREWKNNSFDIEFEDSHLNSILDQEADQYSVYIAKALQLQSTNSNNDDYDFLKSKAFSKLSLMSILLFYYKSQVTRTHRRKLPEWDPLIIPIASSILSAGIPTEAASVMLANIFPSSMPLMVLNGVERFHAAKSLHVKFYLLACYHVPLLVYHLDRYAPGWYWPKKPKVFNLTSNDSENDNSGEEDDDINATERVRNIDSYGAIPMSWFLTLFADEDSIANPEGLLRLWDVLLTTQDNSLKYFLALATLEEHSHALLMLRGEAVEAKLHEIMSVKALSIFKKSNDEPGEDNDQYEESSSVKDWCEKAKLLLDSTPNSVSVELCKAEDEALTHTLLERQKYTEELLRVRLSAEAALHRKKEESEKKRQEDETKRAITKAQLISFYQKYNPDKLDSIDLVLEQFKGRYDKLDDTLKKKYGHGFRLDIKAKTNQIFASMNEGLNASKIQMEAFNKRIMVRPEVKETEEQKIDEGNEHFKHNVAVQVAPEDILPNICETKASKMTKELEQGQYTDTVDVPINFYLIDSRSEDVAKSQGRFPKAICMSPESLLDPDQVQKELDTFESLRGSVHICVMGEGTGSLPELYGHELNDQELALATEDQSKTDMCALFFIKKGFPFVSTLKGGFAGAHAWLAREGPFEDMNTVLIDYDQKLSQLARLEISYNKLQAKGSTGSKNATRAMQNFLESSMTSLTLSATKIDEIAKDGQDNRMKMKESVTNFFSKVKNASIDLDKEEYNIFNKDDTNTEGVTEEKTASVDTEDKNNSESKGTFQMKNPFSKKIALQFSSKDDEDDIDANKDIQNDQSPVGFTAFKNAFKRDNTKATEEVNESDNNKAKENLEKVKIETKTAFLEMKNKFMKKQKDVEEEVDSNKSDGQNKDDTSGKKSTMFEMKNPFVKSRNEKNEEGVDTVKDASEESNLLKSVSQIRAKANFPSFRGRYENNNSVSKESPKESEKDETPKTSLSMFKKNPFTGLRSNAKEEATPAPKKTDSMFKSFKSKNFFNKNRNTDLGAETFSESEESISFD